MRKLGKNMINGMKIFNIKLTYNLFFIDSIMILMFLIPVSKNILLSLFFYNICINLLFFYFFIFIYLILFFFIKKLKENEKNFFISYIS